MSGNSGATSTIGYASATYTEADDFAALDQLPPELRAWYANAALLWSASDALSGWQQGYLISEIIEKLDQLERNVLEKDRPKIWNKDYPKECLHGKPKATIPDQKSHQRLLGRKQQQHPRLPTRRVPNRLFTSVR